MADNIGNFTSSKVGIPAVHAASTGPTAPGIWASSVSGIGLLSISTLAGKLSLEAGLTPGGSGVTGENGQPYGIGVTGSAVGEGGIGVQGNAMDGTAVQGTATTGTGVSAVSSTGTALSVTSSGVFNSPQIVILQNTPNDFARIRMELAGSGGQSGWDIASGTANDVFNIYSAQSKTNVISAAPNGNVTVSGSLQQHSSRELKEDICDLTYVDALNAFANLSPVQYQLRSDRTQSRHLGFIAEDMPDLIAASDRKTVCQMDIVAVLTKVVHQLQSDNLDLLRRIERLESA